MYRRGRGQTQMWRTFKMNSLMKLTRQAYSLSNLVMNFKKDSKKYILLIRYPTLIACSMSFCQSRKLKNRRCVTVWPVTELSIYT